MKRRANTHRHSEAGFILSETLIALTIIAMAVSLFLVGAAAILGHVERASQRAAAAMVANDIIAELRLVSRACPQDASGVRDGLAWRLDVECLSQAQAPLHLGLARVTVTVRWSERPQPAELRLETWHWVTDAQ